MSTMSSTTADRELRDLNDYESMLATSTCNVALRLRVPCSGGVAGGDDEDVTDRCGFYDEVVESYLRQAWSRCVSERTMLQVRLVPRSGEDSVGPLGQRYGLCPVDDDAQEKLFTVRRGAGGRLGGDNDVDVEGEGDDDMVTELKVFGTTKLDIGLGTYAAECRMGDVVEVENLDGEKCKEAKMNVTVLLSLCHALSDGPGTLQVARSFLVHLGRVVGETTGRRVCSEKEEDSTASLPIPHPLTDLQSSLLGVDYGVSSVTSSDVADELFPGVDEISRALTATQTEETLRLNGMTLIPPETAQNIPTDAGFGHDPGGFVDAVHFALSVDDTASLRTNCRVRGATIQGALTAAALTARVKLLRLPLPVIAAVQVPVDTRSLVTPTVDRSVCLCGSAAVWHTAEVREGECIFELARRSTESVREVLKTGGDQPREWLRRLMNDPATLPPFSLMESSIGVAPIDVSYGGSVDVKRVLFFGGALRSDDGPPSVARSTMIHAVTFAGELNCMLNFTSPGISKAFMEDTAKEIEATLLSMAQDRA